MDKELAPGRNEVRLIEVDGLECVEIVLTQGKVALVDLDDWDRLKNYRWEAVHYKEGRGEWIYAMARFVCPVRGYRTSIRMHRIIMTAPRSKFVDHKDGWGLNNRKGNLRLADNARNQANQISRGGTSKFKGVSWVTKEQRWRAAIHRNGKHIFLGYYKTEDAAARAYDRYAQEVDGEFARLNFPDTA